MSKNLRISSELSLPIELAQQAIVIAGIRGSGKSNTGRVIAEELLKAGVPICVVDPTDAWWGLRTSRDGRGDGFPVFIFGGDHGDLPLEDGHGKTIAEFLVAERVPVVLSIRHLRKNAQRRFVTSLCEELYHLKGRPENRTPLTVFIDESPLFVPQSVNGEVAATVGAIEDLVARGRNAGFGVVLISQRFATINKNVTTQAGVVICHRMTGPQDRKALSEWIEENATIEQYKETLASIAALKDGESWLWAPVLDIYKRCQIRLSETFDSGATPKMGAKLLEPKKLAAIDRDKLKQRLSAAIEQHQANDPALLKKRIAELEREKAAAKPVAASPGKTVEKPVLKDGQITRLQDFIGKLDKAREAYHGSMGRIAQSLQEIIGKNGENAAAMAKQFQEAMAPVVAAIRSVNTAPMQIIEPGRRTGRSIVGRRSTALVYGNGSEIEISPGIDKPTQRILRSLRWWAAIGVEKPTVQQVAPVAGYTASGTFSTYLGRMVSAGLITRGDGEINLTEAGWEAAPNVDAPGSLTDLHKMIFATLDEPGRRIIGAILTKSGADVSAEELAPMSGYAVSGTYSTYLGRLVSRGLITRSRGMVCPTNVLFPPGLI